MEYSTTASSSTVETAYASEYARRAEIKNVREKEQGVMIEQRLTEAANHLKDGRFLAAYHGYLILADDYDHPIAQYQLGLLLKVGGRGVERNVRQAFERFDKAAQQGVADADLELGKLYALGMGVEKNYAKAIELFKKANTPQALCELGQLFALGFGEESDYKDKGPTHYEAAVACFEEALKQGVAKAGCELGKMYNFGLGVQPDVTKARELIQVAADLNVPEALFVLAASYFYDPTTIKNNSTTEFEKLKAAAASGSAKALHMLGTRYEGGLEVLKDYFIAYQYYTRAEVAGCWMANTNLGVMYENGLGVIKNLTTAVEKYRTSAALGSVAALKHLGRMYRDGVGVPRDYAVAIDYFRRAAELGDQKAWAELLAMRNNKQGDVGDYDAAYAYYETAHKNGLPRAGKGNHNDYGDDNSGIVRYYQKAAQQNDRRAFYNLGMLSLEGRGVQKNLTRALEYLEQAAAWHDPQAKRQLERMLRENTAEIVYCYKSAADNNESWAHVALGKLYALGVGVNKNYAEAIKHFKAAKTPQALCELGKLFALGFGDESDYKEQGATHHEAAVACFAEALEQGVPEAGCELAKMYYYGCGVVKDEQRALPLIQAAARLNVPEAFYILGLWYFNGVVVTKNLPHAIQQWRAAVALGFGKAMFELGFLYWEGEGGMPHDVSIAFRKYERVALSYFDELSRLGFIYDVREYSMLAIEQYQVAAQQGSVIALYHLGVMYRDGRGGANQNYATAIDYFKRAAELGDNNSWIALKAMRDNKQGDVGDIDAALVYYEEAHRKGLPRPGVGLRNHYGNDNSGLVRYYQKAAQQNDPRAFYNLGMMYLEGRGVQKNLTRALEYLEQAIALNDLEAKFQLARMLRDNAAEVVRCYQIAADKNESWAQVAMGRLYALGEVVETNYAEAINYFKAANTPQALCELGKLFALGFGETSDYQDKGSTHHEAAVACFEEALKQGVAEAGCELAKMYFYACGVPKDEQIALKLMEKAADLNVPEALYFLGWWYFDGIVVKKNQAVGIEKLKAAAALGSGNAMFWLGEIYSFGEGVPQDYAIAFRYYSQAEVMGVAGAANNLGTMYRDGYGVEKNLTTAINRFQESAELESHIALYHLGWMYRDGQGVIQDYATAIDFFRRSAELGCQDAWDALKDMRDNKQGDVGDYDAARTYYETAHNKGLPRVGAEIYNSFGMNNSGIVRYYQNAAQQNDPRAFYNLGMLHIEGRGVQKNLTRGLELIEQAAQLGDLEAKRRLDRLLKSNDKKMQEALLIIYIASAKQFATWAILGLGLLYADGSALVQQDRLRGWGYLDDLAKMSELDKLSALDYARIAQAKKSIADKKQNFKGQLAQANDAPPDEVL